MVEIFHHKVLGLKLNVPDEWLNHKTSRRTVSYSVHSISFKAYHNTNIYFYCLYLNNLSRNPLMNTY